MRSRGRQLPPDPAPRGRRVASDTLASTWCALGVLLCLACGTAPAKPQEASFATGKDPRFPPDRYVTGLGRGPELAQARLAAFADIGAQLQARIESTLIAREKVMNGPAGSSTWLEVTSDLRQHTTFDHRGLATVADSRVVNGAVEVLAVLDRAALAEPFRRDADKLLTSLRRALDDFAAAETRLDLRAAGRLAREIRQRAHELAPALVRLEATLPDAATAEAWADVARAAQIDADLRRLRGKASVEFCVTPARELPEGSQLVQAMMDHVAGLGLTALPCGKAATPATFRAEGSISAIFSSDALLAGAVFCRPSIDLRLLDGRSGAEVLSAPLGGDGARAAGRDREAATRAALKNLSGQCATRLSEALGDTP